MPRSETSPHPYPHARLVAGQYCIFLVISHAQLDRHHLHRQQTAVCLPVLALDKPGMGAKELCSSLKDCIWVSSWIALERTALATLPVWRLG